MLSAIRPDDQSLALLLHVLGAMLLTGGLLAATSSLVLGRASPDFVRLGYYALLAIAVPGWVAMFSGAEWIYREQGRAEEPIDSAWILVGFLVAEIGGVLLLVALFLGGIGMRRLRSGKGASLLTATTLISLVLLAANAVAVWAMSGKPG